MDTLTLGAFFSPVWNTAETGDIYQPIVYEIKPDG